MSVIEATAWIVVIVAVTVVTAVIAFRDRSAVREYRTRLAHVDEDLRALEYAVVHPDAAVVSPRPRSLRSYPRLEHLDRVPLEHLHLYREKLRNRALNLRLARGAITVALPLVLAYWLDDLIRLSGGVFAAHDVESDGILAAFGPSWFGAFGSAIAIVTGLVLPAGFHVWTKGEIRCARDLQKEYEARLRQISSNHERGTAR